MKENTSSRHEAYPKDAKRRKRESGRAQERGREADRQRGSEGQRDRGREAERERGPQPFGSSFCVFFLLPPEPALCKLG